MQVRSIVETLRSNGHNGFPVLHRGPDGERLICGVVLRQQLLTLLGSGSRSMQPSPTVNDSSSRAALSYRCMLAVRGVMFGWPCLVVRVLLCRVDTIASRYKAVRVLPAMKVSKALYLH